MDTDGAHPGLQAGDGVLGLGGASREGGSGLSCPLAFTSLSPAHAKGTQISR